MSQCVIFCTPSLTHSVCLEYFASMVQTGWLLSSEGIAYGFKQVAGDQFIVKARNRLASEFLDEFPMATDLFFLDDDIGWPPEKVIAFLKRDEDIVLGAYPKKTEGPEYAIEMELTDGEIVERDGLYRVISGPAGFMRIKRHVLERLAKESPIYMEPDLGNVDRRRYSIFESGCHIKERRWWGEDYAFCQKVRQAGFEIWVDPDIAFTHRGNKLWTGMFADLMHPKIAAWREAKAAAETEAT